MCHFSVNNIWAIDVKVLNRRILHLVGLGLNVIVNTATSLSILQMPQPWPKETDA